MTHKPIRMTKVAALIVLGVLLSACTEAHQAQPPMTPASATVVTPRATSTCALGVPGARVFFIETRPGARLLFTAEPSLLDELRRRVLQASAMHGPGARRGEGHEGHHGDGGRHGLQVVQMPPVRAEGSVFENGAFIDFVAVDPKDRAVVLAKLRGRVEAMTEACSDDGGEE